MPSLSLSLSIWDQGEREREKKRRRERSSIGRVEIFVQLPRETNWRAAAAAGGRARAPEKLDLRHLLERVDIKKLLFVFLFLFKKDELGGEEKPVYKKVAVVEEFFDIIYREHVEYMNQGGRPTANGKHAGQKRTYRAVSFFPFSSSFSLFSHTSFGIIDHPPPCPF